MPMSGTRRSRSDDRIWALAASTMAPSNWSLSGDRVINGIPLGSSKTKRFFSSTLATYLIVLRGRCRRSQGSPPEGILNRSRSSSSVGHLSG
jgi:hypothetical protein